MAEPAQSNDDDDEAFDPADAPKGGFRDRMRSKPGIGHLYRAGVFVAGLLCILSGIALVVLPGPLTIPPIILGLYIWSTEFRFADKVFDKFKEQGREAWEHAKRHPVRDGILTVGGLVLAGVAFWAIGHFNLIDKAKDAIGI